VKSASVTVHQKSVNASSMISTRLAAHGAIIGLEEYRKASNHDRNRYVTRYCRCVVRRRLDNALGLPHSTERTLTMPRHIKHPIPRFEKYLSRNDPRGPVKGCLECQMILERHPNNWIQHHDWGHHTWGPNKPLGNTD
jgi:hypothetical protein